MKGWIGLALVTLGIVVAASFGARNGERHVAYRQASADVAMVAEGESAEGAIARREAIGLPQPAERMQQWFAVGGAGWGVGLVFILVGAVLARRQAAEDAAGTGSSAVQLIDFEASMVKAREEVERISDMIAELPMDADSEAPRLALDQLGAQVLDPLVEGRGQLIAKHGLAGFASYFGPFSAAERNLNRTWSALTDGHTVVARQALRTADAALQASLEAYRRIDA